MLRESGSTISESNAIYNNLYQWSISKIVCNTSESDNRTDMSSISKDRTAYFHFQLQGGEPNGSAKVSYYLQYSSGQSNSMTYEGTWRNGQWLWTSIWWEGRGYRPSATVTLTVYVNGVAVGSRSLSRP